MKGAGSAALERKSLNELLYYVMVGEGAPAAGGALCD
jgi:hypothetical protein